MKRVVAAAFTVAVLSLTGAAFANSVVIPQSSPWWMQKSMPTNPATQSTPQMAPSYSNAPYQPPYGTWGHNYEENPAGRRCSREHSR
jgi:hypothetical protein